MLPLLEFSADNKEHSIKEFLEPLSTYFKLTGEEKNQTLQNGSTVLYNRLGWAQTYLKQAGLIQSTRRGFFRITERGSQILDQKPTKIDAQFLSQFPEFANFSIDLKKMQ